MAHEMYASTRAGKKRTGLLFVFLTFFVSHMCWPLPSSSRAFFLPDSNKGTTKTMKKEAETVFSGVSKKVRDQLGTWLANDKGTKKSWQTFCKDRGLEPLAPLEKQPGEAMEDFLADPALYKQKELLEFLNGDNVNVPLKGLHEIREDDPIAKSALVRELTLKQFRALIAESPEMLRLWSKFWAEKLTETVGTDDDDARKEMAMKSSFEKAKTPEPGTWEAMQMAERYFDGQTNNLGDLDIDSGSDGVR